MNTDSINNFINDSFSEKRKIHTEGVRITAIHLAQKYGADPEKAEMAALCHDMYRGVDEEKINFYVRELNLDDKYLNNRNLAHSKIGAIVMKRDFAVEDEDIINAVSYHTTGRAGMSLLEKIIYIADAIEPGRDYPGVNELRKLAEKDLDDACLFSLTHTIDYVNSQGSYLDKDTIEARDYFLQKENCNGK